MYLADYHVHSSCSPDGHLTMADMARQGIARGLDEICFTDHVDTIEWGTTHLRSDCYDWEKARQQYQDWVRSWVRRTWVLTVPSARWPMRRRWTSSSALSI